MNATALTLAKAGFVAVAVDTRGHGASGSRGDIGYVGQLEDDLADLVAHLRADYTTARLTLVGHSSGGGFVLRVAAAPVGASFDRFVLLAPYLGYRAPTNRAVGRAGALGRARPSPHRRADDARRARNRLGAVAAGDRLRQPP